MSQTNDTITGYWDLENGVPAEDSTTLECIPKTCPTLNLRRGVEHNCSGLTTWERCTVSAEAGFEMQSYELWCDPSGMLNGPDRQARAKPCEDPIIDPNVMGTNCEGEVHLKTCRRWCLPDKGYVAAAMTFRCDLTEDGNVSLQELYGRELECANSHPDPAQEPMFQSNLKPRSGPGALLEPNLKPDPAQEPFWGQT